MGTGALDDSIVWADFQGGGEIELALSGMADICRVSEFGDMAVE